MARRETPPRERILASAHTEFAERGLAGARIDTIARNAEASKERLYAHFKTKRDLFDAALGSSIDRWLEAVPLDANDMPGWASRLYLHFSAHVDDARMILWGQIEGVSLSSPGIVDHEELEARRERVREAQASGLIDSEWRVDEVFTMAFGLVLSWFVTPSTTNLHREDTERRAIVVREAVDRMLSVAPIPVAVGE